MRAKRNTPSAASRHAPSTSLPAGGIQTAILDALPANIALLSPAGEILAVNASWRKFGAANSVPEKYGFVGQNYLEICERATGDSRGEALATAQGIRRVLQGEAPEFALEYSCHSPTSARWFRIMVSPLHSDRLAGAAVMHVDITERRLAEEALRRSEQEQRELARALAEEKSRLVTAQSVAKVGSWETNLATLEVIWSEETHHIFGTNPATFEPTHGDFLARVHPDDRAGVAAAFERSLAKTDIHKIEHRIVLPDGSIKSVEERWRVIHDSAHRAVRAVGTCRDITERKRSQAERELIFNLSVDLMSITHFDGPLEQVNPAWTKVLGWSAAELIGRPSIDFVLPEDRAATLQARQALIAGKPLRNLENRYRCKDGSFRWLSWNSEPLLETRQVFAVARDITEQKQAVIQLQQDQSMSRLAGRLARIGSWRFDVSTQQIVWSEQLRAIHEVPAGFNPTVEDGINFYAPEVREDIRATFLACVLDGTPFDRELPIITARGRRLWVRVIGEAARDERGAIVQAHGAFQDIDDRKQVEEQNRQLAERLTATLESITDAFFTVDRSWHFTFLNREAERLLAHARGELLGRSIWACFPEAVGTVFEREYSRALRENRSVSFEEFYAPLNTWFSIRAFPSENGLAVYFRDISARVQADRELARTHRALHMLSRCNEALIRTESEDRLLQEVCAIATGIGGFRLAWVGYALEDEARTIVPRAHAGVEDGYLSAIRLSWDAAQPAGQGPAGRTIRSGVPTILTDLADPSAHFVYLEDARKRGYHGVVCLPLKDGARVFGVLALYLESARPVPADELDLLRELADDLAFGIRNLRADEDRRRTHAAVLTMARGISASTGEEFFTKLTHNLIEALDACSGGIARCLSPDGKNLQILSAVVTGRSVADLDYAGVRPPDALEHDDLWLVPRNASALHPGCRQLAEAGIEACAVTRLRDAGGRPIGELFVQFRQPLERPDFVTSTFRIFASRAAAELERQTVDAKTREQAALLDKAQDAIVVRDLQHQITFWNKGAERVYGWTAAEVLGRKIRELLYFDPGVFDGTMQKLMAAGEWSGELVHLRKDGRKLDVEARWTLVRDDHGQPKSVLAINTDLTARKQLEHQFLRAQRMESIGTLAGGIAHDLNNLLAPIAMGVGLLKLHNPPPKSLPVIANIERSTQRGADLVKQVLSFARGVDGNRVPLQARHIIREVEAIIESTFPKDIAIEVSVPGDLPLVLADPTQLNQVLLNLCVNARDAMPQGGRLSLNARGAIIDEQYAAMNPDTKPGAYVVIEITDTGTGIPPEIVDRIFEPFFTTKELGKGTGLGLSTVLGIVRSHGGTVNVRSEPGKGSTFIIHLPAHTDGTTATVAASTAGETLPHGNGELILLVDDEAPILEITQQTLESFGYRVLTARDGARATGLYALHHREIAAVITDLMMPVMDGPALIVALQRINPAVRIIAASGYNAKGSVEKMTGSGVRHFLAKPFSSEALLTALKNVLAGDSPASGTARPLPSV
jgi:PAS domain S-box-containing protein